MSPRRRRKTQLELIQIDNRRTSSRKKSAFALKEKLSGSTASISAIDASKIANDEFEKAYQKPHKGQYAQISIESEKHEMIGADTKTPTVEDDEYLDELDKDSLNMATVSWKDMFTDPILQDYISTLLQPG